MPWSCFSENTNFTDREVNLNLLSLISCSSYIRLKTTQLALFAEPEAKWLKKMPRFPNRSLIFFYLLKRAPHMLQDAQRIYNEQLTIHLKMYTWIRCGIRVFKETLSYEMVSKIIAKVQTCCFQVKHNRACTHPSLSGKAEVLFSLHIITRADTGHTGITFQALLSRKCTCAGTKRCKWALFNALHYPADEREACEQS